jgi:uncharacterized repeat protein (TIGR02543 family)
LLTDTITGATTYVYRFSPKTYKVVFRTSPADGGNLTGVPTGSEDWYEITVGHGQTIGDVIQALPDGVAADATWSADGWDVAPALEGSITNDVTYTYQFSKKTYKVIFKATPSIGGDLTGVPSGSEDWYEITVEHGKSIGDVIQALPDGVVTDETWSAEGWDTEPSLTDTITSNVTYTYQFSKKRITVTFDANGGSEPEPLTMSAICDDAYGTLATTTRPGYEFIGWWTDSENGVWITSGAIVSTPRDHTLYAHWVANAGTQYTVQYYLIDDSGTITLADTVSLTGATGERVTADPRSYDGYTLVSDHPSANPSGIIAGDGSTVLSLYYQINMYTITFVDSDGRVILTVQVPYGGSATPPASPSLFGYIFAGWNGIYMNVTSDTTVTATYTPQQTTPGTPDTSQPTTPTTPSTPDTPQQTAPNTPDTGGGNNSGNNNNTVRSSSNSNDDDDTDDNASTGDSTDNGGSGTSDTSDATTTTDDAEVEIVAEEIPDESAPQSSAPEPAPLPDTETVQPEQVPKAAGGSAAWALINLLLTIVTGIIMLMLLITYFVNRRKEEEDSDYEYSVKKRWPLRMLTIMTTIIAVILFVFTEDMRLPMIFTDQYTLWHIVITAATLLLAILSVKKHEKKRVETGAKRA